jgi:hypothetical protein
MQSKEGSRMGQGGGEQVRAQHGTEHSATTQEWKEITSMSFIEQLQKQQAEQREAILKELAAETETAASVKDAGTGAREWAAGVQDVLDMLAWADQKDRAVLAVTKWLTNAQTGLAALGGTDRMAGDLLASTLLAGITGLESEQPELVSRVNAAVDAWKASQPNSIRRAGSGGTRVVDRSQDGLKWKCSCGETGEDRSNANSAKSGYMGHLISKKTGHGFTSKPTGDHPANGIITKAFRDAENDHKGSFTSTQFSAPDGKLYQVTVQFLPGEGKPVEQPADAQPDAQQPAA